MSHRIWIFTDGACSGNPGPGGWSYVLCLFDAPGSASGRVLEAGGAEAHTTNNRMELEATARAIEECTRRVKAGFEKSAALLFTDSNLVIQGITQWIHGWKKKNWVKSDGQPVLNRDLWERLDAAVRAYPAEIEWKYVPGHSGVAGNERVDEIAVAFSKVTAVDLYDGPLEGYSLAEEIFRTLPETRELKPKGAKNKVPSTPGFKAFYLSLVRGKLERHTTWPECESRVKGVAGARFKKISSSLEEAKILQDWKL